ncbi:helix-turn-helix transcriptional regulator [Aeromonas jandaei]
MKTKSPLALPQEGFVRVATVAHTLNISIGTVWRWSAAGKLPPPVKISGKVTGWNVTQLRAWIAAKSATVNQPASN